MESELWMTSIFSKAAGFYSATSLKNKLLQVFPRIFTMFDEHQSLRIAHIGYFYKKQEILKYCFFFFFFFCWFLKSPTLALWTISFNSLCLLLQMVDTAKIRFWSIKAQEFLALEINWLNWSLTLKICIMLTLRKN